MAWKAAAKLRGVPCEYGILLERIRYTSTAQDKPPHPRCFQHDRGGQDPSTPPGDIGGERMADFAVRTPGRHGHSPDQGDSGRSRDFSASNRLEAKANLCVADAVSGFGGAARRLRRHKPWHAGLEF